MFNFIQLKAPKVFAQLMLAISLLTNASSISVLAQDTESLISEELERKVAEAQAQAELAEAKTKIAEAELALAEAERNKIQSILPQTDIEPVDGDIEANNLTFESNVMAHVALRSSVSELADLLEDKYKSKTYILIESEGNSTQNIYTAYNNYTNKCDQIKEEIAALKISFSLVELNTDFNCNIEEKALDTSVVAPAAAILDSVISIVSRFRVNKEFQGITTDVRRESFIAMLNSETINLPKISILSPGFNSLNKTSFDEISKVISSLFENQAKIIIESKALGNEISLTEKKIENLKSQLKLSSSGNNASYITLNNDQQEIYISIQNQLIKYQESVNDIENRKQILDGLTEKIQDFVVESIADFSSIVDGLEFNKLAKNDSRNVKTLYVNIESGGANLLTESLFGNSIKFSGGVIMTYILRDINNKVEMADTLCFHTGYVKFKSNPIESENYCK